MAVQQRVFEIDDLWQLVCDADDDKQYELIEGEVVEMAPPGEEHGFLAGEIYHYFRLFDPHRKLGIPAVETGYYTLEDRSTVLSPDVAFRRAEPAVSPNKKWVPQMPDLAVEIISPSDTMAKARRKAAIYLNNGTQLVWIVIPDKRGVEVCRPDAEAGMTGELIGIDGTLSGESVLPGFTLELSRLFS